MNPRSILVWCVAVLAIIGSSLFSVAADGPGRTGGLGQTGGAAQTPAPGVAGRYSDGGNPPSYIDIRADGTFSLSKGPSSISGSCTFQGSNVTLMMPGNQPADFQVANGILTAPDGMKLHRTGEAAPAATSAQAGAGQTVSPAKPLAPGVAGHYSDGGNTPTNIDLRADGTFSITHESDNLSGPFASQGSHITLMMPGNQPIVFQLANGILTAPDGMKLHRTGEVAPATGRGQTGGTPVPAAVIAGPSQIWHPWNASVPGSHPVGEAMQLTFVNRHAGPVKIYWLSGKKERTFYWEIPPGETHRQGAKKGAVWFATDSATDTPLGYFLIDAGATQAVIP